MPSRSALNAEVLINPLGWSVSNADRDPLPLLGRHRLQMANDNVG